VTALRFVLGVGVVVSASACGARPAEPNAPSSAPKVEVRATARTGERTTVLGPARLFPPAGRSDVAGEEIDPDGSRRYVAQGLRVTERPDGSLEAAETWLPIARNLRAVPLPPRLGAGFLFVVATGGSTLVFSAPSWTGPLKPVVRLEGEVEQVLAGFDRIYMMLGRGSQWIAIDAATGQGLDLGSLPRSAGYGAMAFADEWFGVVMTPYRGALATFDAGATWHPLGADVASATAFDGNVILTTSGGGTPASGSTTHHFVLDSAGVVLPFETEDARPPSAKQAELSGAAGPVSAVSQRPLGPRPLETAVLHGFPVGDGSALVAAAGMLARVRLADGAVTARSLDAYPGVSVCEAVPLADGAGFVCGEQGAGAAIYAFEPPLSLRLVAEFAEPRRVASSGNGALVVSDGCGRERDPSVSCVFPRNGRAYEIPVVEPGVERVVALGGGGFARISPPRLGQTGTLVVSGAADTERRVTLDLPKTGEKLALAIVRDGLWLDSFEEGPKGELRGWAVGGGGFCGVRIKRDGTVSVGQPQQYLDRALLSGAFGLVVTRAGAALETTDGGFEWSDAEFPTEPEWKAQRTLGAAHGCTRLGCAFSGWLRVGWGMGPSGRLSIAQAPETTRFRQPTGNRWSLDCDATGETSRVALTLPEEAGENEPPRPSPLAEIPAPLRPASERMFDAGSEPELRAFRAYAWGPPLEAWPKNARFMLRAVDPHAVDKGVWSTAPTPAPWTSPESTADAFGQSPNGPPASLRMVFDPVAHAGIFVVNVRGASELYLVEEGKDIVRLKTSGATGVVSSFARAGRNAYVSALGENQTLRIYRVEASSLASLGDYVDVVPRAELPRLAPSTRGDGLGLWVRAGNYYLYPLDPRSGALDAPIEIPADKLGVMPRACSADEDGYVVGDALSLAPRIDLHGAPFSVGNGIEVRLIVSASDICTHSVSAPAGGTAARSQPSPERKTTLGVPLVVSDPRPGGARRGFRCWD
jgi:hypothetical protein